MGLNLFVCVLICLCILYIEWSCIPEVFSLIFNPLPTKVAYMQLLDNAPQLAKVADLQPV